MSIYLDAKNTLSNLKQFRRKLFKLLYFGDVLLWYILGLELGKGLKYGRSHFLSIFSVISIVIRI